MMRKIFFIFLIAIGLVSATRVFAASEIEVVIDNQKIQFANSPRIENGTTSVEFRTLFEKLGLQVDWDPQTLSVTGSRDGLVLKLEINRKLATVNGREIYLSTAPYILNGYTMVPLRFVAEYSGQKVDWQEDTGRIQITSRSINEKPLYVNDKRLTSENTADYFLGYFNARNKDGIYTTQPITLGYILGISKGDIYFDSSNTITFPTLNITVSEENITHNNKRIYDKGLSLESGVSYIPIQPIIEAVGGRYEEKESGIFIYLENKK